MSEAYKAISWDIDDVVVDRGRMARYAGLVNGKIRPHKQVLPDRSAIPVFVRHVEDIQISGAIERSSFFFHAGRHVFPHIPDFLHLQTELGVHHYGNTGRSNKRDWVNMTWDTLAAGGAGEQFRDIFFTPDGMKTAVSKASGIAYLQTLYSQVDHYEDDPRTAAFLAHVFPEVTIYLVHYGTTGLLYSHQEVASTPNILRVAVPGIPK